MIACFLFNRKLSEHPRLAQLLKNEFYNHFILFEKNQMVFVFHVNDDDVKRMLFLFDVAQIEVASGLGYSKKEAYYDARRHLPHESLRKV